MVLDRNLVLTIPVDNRDSDTLADRQDAYSLMESVVAYASVERWAVAHLVLVSVLACSWTSDRHMVR